MNKKCQVFTPENYVAELLDNIGYTQNVHGKKILENSCGDGNILVVIVQRYIEDCMRQGFSKIEIRNGLERDIYGVEIDPEQYNKCIFRLNEILERNHIEAVRWNITNEDYLRKDDTIYYQFIVGNPPYITYKEMEREDQVYLKNNFAVCKKGKFDYCYAFIEKSLKSLDSNGKMAYLIPSSIFKTVFGENLRLYMQPYIETIFDFTQEKMFGDALVKSAIMVLSGNRADNYLCYTDVALQKTIELQIDSLGKKWFFTENTGVGERRFGDYFKVSHVVATLLNEAYVLKGQGCIETEDYYEYNNHKIEKEVVRVAASPRVLRYNKTENIIFPYYYENGRLKRYEDDEFIARFPGVTGYLNSFRKGLDERKSDENTRWFEYGRTQALSGLNEEKLLVSTVMTAEVAVYRLSAECIPYAGMYIVPQKDNNEISLDEAMRILQDKKFMQYVLDVGIHISGSSVRITSKDIEEYRF